MADGDYERGREREISSLAAKLRRLKMCRATPKVLVLNGWSASEHAWDLCSFAHDGIFSYVDQLDGLPEREIQSAAPNTQFVLAGWSMGGSSALRLACMFPGRIAALVLVAATPRMMEDRETGWRGMSPRRLEALQYGLKITHGEGLFGTVEGRPNPYMVDDDVNLERGLEYLRNTDLRAELVRVFGAAAGAEFPVFVFQSTRDGIVRSENAAWLKSVFPKAEVCMVDGTEHALPIEIPDKISSVVNACMRQHRG